MSKLEIKPTTIAPKNGDIVIHLTDIQLHTNARIPESAGKGIRKKIETMKPGRAVFPISHQETDVRQGEFSVVMNLTDDANFVAMVEKYNQEGKRVIITIPKNMPVYAGKDTVEFMNSKQGRRIHRRIEKQRN